MSRPRSMEDLVSQLQQLLRQKYESGVTARLECNPRAAVSGTVLAIRAVIFGHTRALAELKPVLRFEGVEALGAKAFKERRAGEGFREYTTRFRSDELRVGQMYRLNLHPRPEADPIATCTVHMFQKALATAVRRQLREIITPRPAPRKAARRRR